MADVEYADGRGVDARAAFYSRDRGDRESFGAWVFDRLDLPAGGRVLDCGCGPGTSWASHADRLPAGPRIVLLDLSPGMLADAGKRLGAAGIPAPRLRASAVALPLADGSFEAVVTNHMLYDVDDLPRAIGELRRVLVRGGALHATTNGSRHLVEFRRALHGAGLRGEFVEWAWHDRFDLCDGATALRRCFDDVHVLTREEILPVDDPEALVAYADSLDHLRARFDDERRQAFRGIVNAEIARRGAFTVTCESGLVVARWVRSARGGRS